MTILNNVCRIVILTAIGNEAALRDHVAQVNDAAYAAAGAGTSEPLSIDRLIERRATVFQLRDGAGRVRAACHLVVDEQGIVHIEDLVRIGGCSSGLRQCVAAAIVFKSAIGHRSFTADLVDRGRDGGNQRPGNRPGARTTLAMFRLLGFATVALAGRSESSPRAEPDGEAAERQRARIRVVYSTEATAPAAHAFLSAAMVQDPPQRSIVRTLQQSQDFKRARPIDALG